MAEEKGRPSPDMGAVVGAGVFIGIGVAAAGWFIGDGFVDGRKPIRSVTVKGLAEQTVSADVAVWTLRFVASGDDLNAVQEKIERDTDAVRAFLTEGGLPAGDISLDRLQVVDQLAEQYRSGPIQGNRFIINQSIMVRTEAVDLVQSLSRRTGEIVRQGVVLQDAGLPSFTFTGLNDIKPALIAEATRNARASAEQFAADSGAQVGSILRASQGVIQILPPISSSDYAYGQEQYAEKKIRVVATLDFIIED